MVGQTMQVTETQLVTLIAALRVITEPVPARKLAPALEVPGRDTESRRRRVRDVVEAARSKPFGFRICANSEGYWLARDEHEWAAYEAARETKARFEFVRVRNMRQAAGERTSGQGMLLDVSPSAVELMPT